MPIKIVALGCIHGELKKKVTDFIKSEKPDAVLISGDFSGGDFADRLRKYEKDLVENFGPVMEFWPLKVQIESEKNFRKWGKMSAENTAKVFRELKKLSMPVYYVHGNWDSVSMGMKGLMEENSGDFFVDENEGGNMHFIHGKMVHVKGFNIIGYGGYRGTASKEYLIKDLPEPRPDSKYAQMLGDQMRREMEKLFVKVKDGSKTILLTHDPPYKVLDYLASAKKNYGEKMTSEIIEKHAPILCVCSHFHEHQGIAKIKNTTVVNSGYGHDGQLSVIEIDDKVAAKTLRL